MAPEQGGKSEGGLESKATVNPELADIHRALIGHFKIFERLSASQIRDAFLTASGGDRQKLEEYNAYLTRVKEALDDLLKSSN
jgi:hypothetical protein